MYGFASTCFSETLQKKKKKTYKSDAVPKNLTKKYGFLCTDGFSTYLPRFLEFHGDANRRFYKVHPKTPKVGKQAFKKFRYCRL